jgi:cytoskeleton protein RodZ
MAALGEQLSAARKKLGLTPAEVGARLRIRTSFVDALERERWSVVGAPVYVRGFLRNYAKMLSLDPEAVLSQLPEDQQPSAPVQIADISTAPDFFTRPQSRARTAVWYPWLLGSLTVIAAFLVINVAVALFSSHTSSSQLTSAANNATGFAPIMQPQLTTSNTLQANAAAQSNAGVNLRLQLTQRSWLSVTVDGKRVVYETLPAGTIREFHGDREISLRAGNAGGVVANFDGKDLGMLGTAGQVEDRVFAAKTPSYQLTGPHE